MAVREGVAGSRWGDCGMDLVVWGAGRISLEWWIAEDWNASTGGQAVLASILLCLAS